MPTSPRDTARKLGLFRRLFAGRQDVYGTYDAATGRARQVKAPVTNDVLLAHIQGRRPYGVYLLTGDRPRAVAADFDTNDLDPVVGFDFGAGRYGLTTYIERSKAKGYHAWIFFDGPVPAAKARRVVAHILEEIDEPHTEVFPKQDALRADATYGNFINVPLFGALVPKGRTVFVDRSDPTRPHPDQWALLENVQRVSESRLDEIIALNDLTMLSPGPDSLPKDTSRPDRTYGLMPCANRMLATGVSTYQRVACFRLAVQLKRTGLPHDLAVAALVAWAHKNKPREGKRIITPAEIRAQAAGAYRNEYRSFGCEDPAIMPFCDPACPVTRERRGPSTPDADVHNHERTLENGGLIMPLTMHERPELPADEFMRARASEIQGLDEPIPTENGECLRFVFELLDPPHAGRIASVLTPARLEQHNRLHRLLQQMGLDAAVGESVEVESLVGSTFMVKVGPVRNGYQNVTEVRAA